MTGLLICALTPLPNGFLLSRIAPLIWRFHGGWGATGFVLAVTSASSGEWAWAAAGAANAALAAICWWLSRRKRRHVAKLIGATSRALLAAVVARMKDALKPRTVLRPVPGGASWS